VHFVKAACGATHKKILVFAKAYKQRVWLDVRIVLAGTEVVFVNLGIEILSGELEGIIKGATLFDGFAEGFVGVIFDDAGGGIYYLPDTAQSVVQVEVSAGGMVAIMPGNYLAVGVTYAN